MPHCTVSTHPVLPQTIPLTLSFPYLQTFHMSLPASIVAAKEYGVRREFYGIIFQVSLRDGICNRSVVGGQVNPVSTVHVCLCILKRTNVIHATVSQRGLKPFVSRSQFSLLASADQHKSLVLQREGAVSFIQLFSTSTSVCQGGGKRRLNTLCNSTRPDAVLLRFNVPFFCLCR